jgi:hypothetical protein
VIWIPFLTVKKDLPGNGIETLTTVLGSHDSLVEEGVKKDLPGNGIETNWLNAWGHNASLWR